MVERQSNATGIPVSKETVVMSLKVAFQMDPIGAVDINADSSFRIAEEAQKRGHDLFFYTPDKLAYEEGRVTAVGHRMELRRVEGDHVTLQPEEKIDLDPT